MTDHLNCETIPSDIAHEEASPLAEPVSEAAAPPSPRVPATLPGPDLAHPTLGNPTAVWEYRDERGNTLGFYRRFDPPDKRKQFRPLTPADENGQLVWKPESWSMPRPLFGLDRLAARQDTPVLVVEGEKAAVGLDGRGGAAALVPSHVVITSPGGSKAAASADWSPLRGRDVVIWPDADKAGTDYARDVAEQARKAGARSVRIVDTSGLPEKFDLGDPLPDGLNIEARLCAAREPASNVAVDHDTMHDRGPCAGSSRAGPSEGPPCDKTLPTPHQTHEPAEQKRARSQRDQLVDLAIASGAEFWQDPVGDTYVTVDEDGRRRNFHIHAAEARKWLTRLYAAESRHTLGRITAPGGQALKDAIGALDAHASEGPVRLAFVRIGYSEARIYIDLGDGTGRAVEVTQTGWQLVDNPPVRFVRPAGLLPLPEPVRHTAGVRALLSILPDAADAADATDATDARIILLAFLVGTFLPQGGMPLLAVSGRQGSGKTTLVNCLRSLVDPNQAPARQQPRTEDDLIIAARNGAIVSLDNISFIDTKQSDALCRLTTGAGHAKRKLYTDLDEVIVQVRRPAIINGIPDLIRMPDLADRALVVELAPRSSYAPLSELDEAFEQDRPMMLGALYDAISAGGARRAGTLRTVPVPLARCSVLATDRKRTLAWISRRRRLARDYERHARKTAAFVRLTMIRLMLRRLPASLRVSAAPRYGTFPMTS